MTRYCCSVACLSVCLSVTFVNCAKAAEDIDMISFAYDSPMSLRDHLAYTCQPLPPQILPRSDPTPVVRDIQWQIVTRWLEIVKCSQWRAYRKSLLLFQMVQSPTPYDLSFPQYWVLLHMRGVAFRQITLAVA